jgi:hypothetical protein
MGATMSDAERCPCHPPEVFPSTAVCPVCRHWSYEPSTGACQRSACGYTGSGLPEPQRKESLAPLS